eukprot:CAMPEP_0184719042 /NCGR_PEP_ID=MMETSP0314-20130426/8059_1 /TAXON_ID=38298 /ORGANISM="Rhodella maculata, Strain CCMP 736" /LENGTH=164 /DNA_ID=CAMNT_0027182873 /DNA_START=441 /DNA_END=933 /DNA_ORIENTATION=-
MHGTVIKHSTHPRAIKPRRTSTGSASSPPPSTAPDSAADNNHPPTAPGLLPAACAKCALLVGALCTAAASSAPFKQHIGHYVLYEDKVVSYQLGSAQGVGGGGGASGMGDPGGGVAAAAAVAAPNVTAAGACAVPVPGDAGTRGGFVGVAVAAEELAEDVVAIQ